jgi:hypothetical protein
VDRTTPFAIVSAILWTQLARFRLYIHFAHRTFQWNNDARDVAAVHCVIIGFAQSEPLGPRRLFDYAAPKAQPQELAAGNINAYLLDAPNVLVAPRSTPLCDVPPMDFGSMPNDGGNLLLTEEERTILIAECPDAAPWIRRCLGSREFLNGLVRWCLWLTHIPPETLKNMRPIIERVEAVRAYRLRSRRSATRALANTPALFAENRQPDTRYLMMPKASSADRQFIPTGFMPPEIIATDLTLVVPDADLYLFGILTSSMHMAWVRNIGGRLKSDPRYSVTLTYNAFPFPTPPMLGVGRSRTKHNPYWRYVSGITQRLWRPFITQRRCRPILSGHIGPWTGRLIALIAPSRS